MSSSARKLDELVLPTTKMFPIAGDTVWRKNGIQEVNPGEVQLWRFQCPPRQKIVVDHLDIRPLDLITYEFGIADFVVGTGLVRKEYRIFDRRADTGGAREFEHPDMIWIDGGGGKTSTPFEIRFRNPNPVFVVAFEVDFRLFVERVPN